MRFVSLFMLLLLAGWAPVIGQSSETFTSPGSTTFTVPDGVTQITVQVWGAGGAGGAGTQQGQTRRSGGGGGGGAYQFQTYAVTPGQVINITIGAGGSTSAAAGGNSQISFGATTLIANGGTGGSNATGGGGGSNGAGGAGGTGGTYNGGSGASGVADNGGGGGGSAGTGANGNNGSGISGGTAVTGGGAGGNGASIDGGNGNPGGVPGGGGGGGRGNGSAGGAGGNGQVIVSWSPPNASNSTITASPEDNLLANGTDSSELTITVRDGNNDVMGENVDVFFEITSGIGDLSAGPWSTNSGGLATADLTSTTPGTVTITGYLGTNNSGDVLGTASVTFDDPSTQIRVETADDGTGSVVSAQDVASGNSITVYAIARDVSDNFVGLVTDAAWSLQNITGGVKSGDLVDNLDGSATFTGDLTGSATIRAASGSLDEIQSGTITVVPGSPAQLVFSQQPTNTVEDEVIDPAVTVRIEDSSGNLVNNDNTTQVGIAIANNPSSGNLNGTTPVTASGGIATFNDLSIDAAGNGYTLEATSTGLSSATSNSFNIAEPILEATQIRVETAADGSGTVVPSQDVLSGNSITVYAIARDAEDDFVSLVEAANWSLQNITGGVVSGNLVNNSDGSATFTGGVIGSATIRAASGSLVQTESGTITVIPGSASQLSFDQQPTNTVEEQVIDPAVTVRVEDSAGNLISDDNSTEVNIAIANNPSGGTLSGTTSVTVSGGVATFNDLSINNSGNGYTFEATATGLSTATSSGFDILDKPTFTISGTITDGTDPIENVSVEATGGHSQTVTTNSSGVYSLTGVVDGSQNITITPSHPDYTFSPTSITVNGPVNGNVTNQDFTGTIITYTLTIYFSGDGSAEVNGSPYTSPVSASSGSTLNLEAIPDSGWEFSSWSGDLSSSDAIDTILMDGDKEITANFNPEPTPGVNLRLQYSNQTTNTSSQTIDPFTRVFNDGSETVALSDVTIRYWFTSEPVDSDVYEIFWTPRGAENLFGSFNTIGGQRYLEIGFTSGAGNLTPSQETGEMQNRIRDAAWGVYDQSNDYSFDASVTSYQDYEKITVYYQGNLVWGTPPAGGSEAENMTITQQPSTTTAGSLISPAPTVFVEDALGNGVEGVEVTVSLNKNNFAGGSTTIVTTDSDGFAVFDNLKINTASTGYQITFNADAPLVSNRTSGGFSINAAAADDMSISQQPPGTVTAGSAISPVPAVTILDEFGNPKSGVNVTVSLNKNNFASGTTTVATNSSGVASFSNLVINTAATNYILTFDADASGIDNLNSSVFNVNAATASVMTITTQPSESVAGGIIAGPPTVRITDAFNNPISGINVTVLETGNNYTFDAGTITKSTNANGNVAFNDLQIDTPDIGYELTFDADAASVSNVTSNTFEVVAAGGSMSINQQPTTTEAGEIINPYPSVTVIDGFEDPVEGVEVTVSLNENSFASGTLTVTTNASGVAVFDDLIIEVANTDYQITFDADLSGVSNVFSNNFDILVSDPASMNVTIQPNNTIAGNEVNGPPTVTIVDAFNNPVPDIDISVSLNKNSFASGTYTIASNSNGEAAFSDLVITAASTAYQIIFDADANDVSNVNSNNFNITAAAANAMSITTQPGSGTSGSLIDPAPVVLVTDVYNNPKSGVDVTATLNKSNFSGGSTVIVTSNSSGEAVFSNLRINTPDTGYEITFNATDLTSQTSSSFTLVQPDPDFGSLRLQYSEIAGDATNSVINFGFRVFNESGLDLELDQLEVRYWFTSEPGVGDVYEKDWVQLGAGNVNGDFNTIAGEYHLSVTISDETILEVGLGGDNMTPNLYPAGATTGIIEGRIRASNWANYNENDDYSYDPTITDYTDYMFINVYYKGKLVWGEQPAAVEGGVELEFDQQPTETVQDETIDPPVTVRILDRDGNLASSDNETEVTISIDNDPSTGATLSGTTTVTAVNGVATFSNLSIDNVGMGYTLKAEATGLDEDISNSFNILSAFTFSISGTILDDENNPIQGVDVTATGGHSGSTSTNSNGEYSIIGIEWGTENVTVTPEFLGYTFDPVDITISGPITDDVTGQDFVGTAGVFIISGTITDGSVPIEGVEVVATGDISETVFTNLDGEYQFNDIDFGSDVTITPVEGAFTYTPTSITLNNITSDQTGQDFVGATTGSRTISGTIKDQSDNPVAGVSVVASGDHTQTVSTNSSGFYQFSGIATGNRTITITPTPDGYTFDPTSITVNNNFSGTPNVTGQDFAATVVAGTYYSRATGNWNVAANWSTDSHAGTAAGRAPKSLDEIIIGGGHTITLNLTTFTLDDPGTLTVNDTGILEFPGQNHVTGTGSFTLATGGGLIIGSSNGITASGSNGNVRTSNRTFNDGADFTYNGSSSQVTGTGLPQQVNDLRINNSNNVRASVSVQVNGTLYLDNGTFIMSDGLSLIANTKNIDSGQLQYELQIGGQAGYRLLSSPLNVNFGNFLSEVITQGFTGASLTDTEPLQPNVLWYDETFEGTDNQRWRAPGNSSDMVVPGRGYHVYMFGDVDGDSRYNDPLPYTLIVNGQENEGTAGEVDLNVTYTEAGDTGWNLVGNPFGASIDWEDSANWTKTNIDQSIYIWDPNSNQYKTWNGSAGDITDGIIAPFQGFWVKANSASPELTVSREAKTIEAGAGYVGKAKAAGSGDAVISIQAFHSDHLNSTVHFSFTEDGRLGMDRRDAYRLLPPMDVKDYLEFYSRVDKTERLAVNNLPRRFGRPIELPLELNAYDHGNAVTDDIWLKIKPFKNVPGEWVMELINEVTGEKIPVVEGDSIRVSMAHMKGKNVERTNVSGKVTTKSPKAHINFTLIVRPEADAIGLDREFTLHQNYPNPFNPTTTIAFEVPVTGQVRLEVYDMIGRRVAMLVNDTLPAGSHSQVWDASNLSSGIYIARLITPDGIYTRKLTLIK